MAHTWYLSFFYMGKIFGEENLHRNLHSKLPVYTVNCQFTQWIANLHSKLPIFRVKSVKIYTGQKKIYTDMSVASVTNIRYAVTFT